MGARTLQIGCAWLALALAAPAGAGIYRWTDASGREHFTTDLQQVPPRYRAAAGAAAEQPPRGHVNRAESATSRAATTPRPAPARRGAGASPAPPSASELPGGRDEAYWRSTRDRLVASRDRIKATIAACPANGPVKIGPDGRRKMKRQHYERKQAHANLCTQANGMLSGAELALSNFDEKARRAGVPPGWLR